MQQSDTAVARAQFEHAIAVLVGQPPNSFSLPVAPLDAQPPSIPLALPSQLLERRPDIAAAERRTAEANEQIGIARSAYFPSLGFSASTGFEAGSLSSFFGASNIVYALGPTLGYKFFDAGRRASISAQAYARFDETSAIYKQTTLTAFQQVEDNLAALRILAQDAQQQHEATVAAQGAQKNLRQPLRRGNRHLSAGGHRAADRAHQRAQRHRHRAPAHGRFRAPDQGARRRLVNRAAAAVCKRSQAVIGWLQLSLLTPGL